MADGIMVVEDGSFEQEVLKSEQPVMVDFWAPWCGPCKALSPVIEELASAYGNQIKFTKCNVDDNPVTPRNYGIRSIPTLIFFKDGEVSEQIIGAVAKKKLEEAIAKVL